jgi:DNA polymerase-3 subunit alpha
MTVLPRAIEVGAEAQDDRRAGQMALFGGGEPAALTVASEPVIPTDEWSEAEMLSHEKSVLGLYVTAHPLTEHVGALDKYATAHAADLDRYQDGADVVLGGMITRMRTVTTRTGRNAGSKMGILTFEDLSGQVEVILFPDLLEQSRNLIAPERIVFVVGRVDRRREEPSVRVTELIPIEHAAEMLAKAALVRINCAATSADVMQRLRQICDQHRGERPLYMEMTTADHLRVTVRCNGGVGVTPSSEFVAAVDKLLGPGHLVLIGPTRQERPQPPRDENRAVAQPPAALAPAVAAAV